MNIINQAIEDRPHCSGKWIGGSGGHRIHEHCNQLAAWWHPDDPYAYCNLHMKSHDQKFYMPWKDDTKKLENLSDFLNRNAVAFIVFGMFAVIIIFNILAQ